MTKDQIIAYNKRVNKISRALGYISVGIFFSVVIVSTINYFTFGESKLPDEVPKFDGILFFVGMGISLIGSIIGVCEKVEP